MKRIGFAALVIGLTLTLSACGGAGENQAVSGSAVGADGGAALSQTGSSTGGTAQGAAAASGAAQSTPEDALPNAAALGREEHGVLKTTLEGETERVDATLYVGESLYADVYSLYIPDAGWRLDEPGRWASADNPAVELEVKFCAGAGLEEARAAILAEEEDYGFSDPDGSNAFTGTDGEEGTVMDVRLFGAAEGVFAVMAEYPGEAAEGFAQRLAAMADTFQVADSAFREGGA